jgi:hypothetical protein
MLRQLSTDSSYDDGDGDYNGVRCSMTAQNSGCRTDTGGKSHTDNCRSRMSRMDNCRSRKSHMDNSHFGNPDNQIRFQLPRYLPRPERQNAERAREVIQLPPVQRIEVFSSDDPLSVVVLSLALFDLAESKFHQGFPQRVRELRAAPVIESQLEISLVP